MRPRALVARSSPSAPRIRSSASSSRTSRGAGLGRFAALARGGTAHRALPRRRERRPLRARLRRLRRAGPRATPRMVIGEEGAVRSSGTRRRGACPDAARRPAGPARLRARQPPPSRGERPARGDARRPRPARRRLRGRVPRGGRRRPATTATRHCFGGARGRRSSEGRSWLWVEDGRDPLQGGGLGLDARRRPAPAGLGRSRSCADRATRKRGAAPICAGCCSSTTPQVCLFVRPENAPAIALYEGIGMRRTITYRSLIFA